MKEADAMNNKTVFLLLAAGLFFFNAQFLPAITFIQTNSFIMSEEETLDNDLWLSANSAVIKGEAKNDLFLLATAQSWKPANEKEGNISLSGKCGNDVWALANKIELNGVVLDHTRLLAQMITVSGSVSNNAILVANSINIGRTAHMGRDIWLIGENIIVEGRVDGNADIIGQNVTLAGDIAGQVRLTAADIVVLPHTRINGNLIYRSTKELILDKNVELNGKLIREAEEVAPETGRHLISWPSLAMQSWLFIGALAVSALMLLLFPAFIENVSLQINRSAWKCLAVGFATICLVPLACFFLAVSVIGLPLALLAAATFLILIYLSKIMVGLALGAFITRHRAQGMKAFPAMGLGLVILYLAAGSGLLGTIVWFVIACLGVGAMVTAYFAGRPTAAP